MTWKIWKKIEKNDKNNWKQFFGNGRPGKNLEKQIENNFWQTWIFFGKPGKKFRTPCGSSYGNFLSFKEEARRVMSWQTQRIEEEICWPLLGRPVVRYSDVFVSYVRNFGIRRKNFLPKRRHECFFLGDARYPFLVLVAKAKAKARATTKATKRVRVRVRVQKGTTDG